ncbi:MAG TPA: low-specificity L-threonine aldolase [Verrucomicrobiales bacterium]|nr:low-specificity L-threonine aldolase [Verrucomicrobiales bacterium]
MKIIDLRSDTVTRPCEGMRKAMAEAEVGDDVFGDDPTVNRLEGLAAEMLGKEAAVFVASGTQANLIALLTHCGRGDEYIAAQQAHTYVNEGGGGASLGGIQPQPLNCLPDGTLDLARVESLIKPDDDHFARTRLLCLENTIGGRVLPEGYVEKARALVDRRGLGLHLDGARLFNAAVKQNRSAADLARPFDSVSVCLSKGLGAPAGSLLTGGRDFIKRARRWRKMLGGGMRQSGILAAAGIFSLTNNVERLAEDHANALRLAKNLGAVSGGRISVDWPAMQTNMIFASLTDIDGAGLTKQLAPKDILILPWNPLRLVIHRDITTEDIDRIIVTLRDLFEP